MSQNNQILINKTAVITGGSKGIGFAIAETLGKAGANIVFTGRKNKGLLEAKQKLENHNINCLEIQAHSGDDEALKSIVEKTIQNYKGIDIIINNAATNPVYGSLLELEDEVINKVFDVNLKSSIKLSKLALPFLKKSKGTIINISSIDGIKPETNRGIYGVSKAALNALTKILAKELAQYQIRVNAVCPGIIKTTFSQALWTDKSIELTIPINRLGTSQEIAELVLFLASNKSSYSTGGLYIADGGYLL